MLLLDRFVYFKYFVIILLVTQVPSGNKESFEIKIIPKQSTEVGSFQTVLSSVATAIHIYPKQYGYNRFLFRRLLRVNHFCEIRSHDCSSLTFFRWQHIFVYFNYHMHLIVSRLVFRTFGYILYRIPVCNYDRACACYVFSFEMHEISFRLFAIVCLIEL